MFQVFWFGLDWNGLEWIGLDWNRRKSGKVEGKVDGNPSKLKFL